MSVNELASTRPMFTEHFHRDVYPAIDPTNPALALTGKTVLVTGGGRGIGVSIVEAFAKAQAKSIILTGRTESSLVAAKEKFTKAFPGVQFIASAVDIGVPESVDAMFKSLNGKVEHIDVLVNNAGVNSEYGVRIGESNVEKFLADININAVGPYLLARGLIQFNPADHPTTFITLSTGINEGFTHMNGYLLSKLPPVKLMQLLDLEYPNLRTFSVIPGLVATDMLIEAFSALALDKAPLVAGVSVYLSHPKADFLSGRFLDARWDIEEVVARKEEIVKNDLLKIQIAGY
ncbi:hypothetical protein M408DRAFT_333213 [Serendipita vermifera MAFF 305830]|uniref:Ketoreductase (KR) domain-containing protein n=1 Tax=Serendipita vermifera MAFF 305830 TaxID=933852 RepID=A0A0C3AP35_SERVB|nr:hypothetical protein M408DRAFT_333213 [Serendipita vermifera MAFF 305830]